METKGYTKEQKEFYQNMMEEIGSHKDFGKRNPVDIGIDCGYSEDDIMKMIQMCQNTVQDDGEAEIYYFMLRKQERRYIVSVNINDWKIEIVKELGEANISRFGIAYDTFVWVLDDNDKVMFWENFRTKKSGKLLLDFDLANSDNGFLVLEDGVIVENINWRSFDHEIIKLGFDKSVRKVKAIGNCCYLDGGDKIFGIDVSYSDGKIYSINKALEGEFVLECESKSSCYSIDSYEQTESLTSCEVGIDNGRPFGYSFYEKFRNKKLFDISKTRVTEKFSLKGFKRTYGHRVEKIDGPSTISDFLVRDFTTEHYQLLGNSIYLKENGDELNEVCRFDRMLNSNQGVSVFSKDIFIGITYLDESDETAIIKIDMQNERKAVILPLEIPAKGKGR